jgi:hypothetical protein
LNEHKHLEQKKLLQSPVTNTLEIEIEIPTLSEIRRADKAI